MKKREKNTKEKQLLNDMPESGPAQVQQTQASSEQGVDVPPVEAMLPTQKTTDTSWWAKGKRRMISVFVAVRGGTLGAIRFCRKTA